MPRESMIDVKKGFFLGFSPSLSLDLTGCKRPEEGLGTGGLENTCWRPRMFGTLPGQNHACKYTHKHTHTHTHTHTHKYTHPLHAETQTQVHLETNKLKVLVAWKTRVCAWLSL
jgi:hypothetical protein